MNVFTDFETLPLTLKPAALTIGTFDGLHLGHQAVLKRVEEVALKASGSSLVVTFENHPSTVLRPNAQVKALCTQQHKLHLLEKYGVRNLLLLPFTKALSEMTPEDFVQKIRQYYPFLDLILGYDATFGKNREGSPAFIASLAQKYHFNVEYITEAQIAGSTVSSRRIRSLLEQGNLSSVAELLGRPYSIYSQVIPGRERGREIGFPTANICVKGLCLPPLGVYAVKASVDGKEFGGVANLGVAPTLKNEPTPLLEVHLFDTAQNLYGCWMEVKFVEFIRKEQRFDSISALHNQIQKDVDRARFSA